MRFVGSSVPRTEDPRLLTGRGRFVDDLAVAGVLHAHFIRSPEAHARIVALDVDAARAAPGVAAVVTGADLAGRTGLLEAPASGNLRVPPHPVLAVDRVRYAGDVVAVVVAESRALAEDAAELADLVLEPLPVVAGIDEALAPDAPSLFDDAEGNVLWRSEQSWGDVDAALAFADHVVRETFVQHRHACVPMETRAGLAVPEPGGLTYHASHQNPHALRLHLAAVLGLSANRIVVRTDDVGGSFGLKSNPTREDLAVCAAAHLLGRPVKWIEDRAEHLVAGGHARDERMHVEAAVRRDGELVGLRVRLEIDHGAYPFVNLPLSLFANIVKVLLPGTLKLRDYAYEGCVVATNKASYVAYRGPWEIECWVRERLMDRIAHDLGIDPVEVRRRNLLPDDRFPTTMLTGPTLDFMTLNETLERAVELADPGSFRAEQAAGRAEGRLLGMGFCTYLEPGPGPTDYSQALGFTYEQRSLQRARVRLELDGTVSVFTSQAPHGQGHETTLAQVVADELGVDLASVAVVHGDTRLTPFNMVSTGGSRAATLASGAAMGAARTVREQVLAVVADRLEANPSDLDIVDGVVAVRGSPDRAMGLAEVARLAHLAPLTLGPGLGLGFDATHDFETPPGGWTQSTHVCWVEVDAATGVVTVPRYLVVEDCGRMINPAVVEGQIRGGVAQGIGSVLYEHTVYDESGQCLTSTFLDYLVPTMADIPEIEIEHLEREPQGDVAFRGVGEGGAIGAPAAVTNAIEDALAHLGVRITEQHLPPSRLLELLTEAGRSPG